VLIFALIFMTFDRYLLVGRQGEHPACNNWL